MTGSRAALKSSRPCDGAPRLGMIGLCRIWKTPCGARGWPLDCQEEVRAARSCGECQGNGQTLRPAAAGIGPRGCGDPAAGGLRVSAAGLVQFRCRRPRVVAKWPGDGSRQLDGGLRRLAGRCAVLAVRGQRPVVARHARVCRLVVDTFATGGFRMGCHPAGGAVWRLVLLLLGTTTLGALHFYRPDSPLPYAAGGILGEGLVGALLPMLGSGGTSLLALAAMLCGVPCSRACPG